MDQQPPRITGLDPDPRHPSAVRVEIDGGRFGTIPQTVAVAEGLALGREIDAAVQERLGVAADGEAAFRTLLRALEVRSFASRDLARRLQRKGHPRPAVDSAVARAAELGLLDDRSFAKSYVETRAARGRGPSRLVRDLLAMGVERSVIEGAIADHWPEGHDQAVPLALARKRAAQLGTLPRQTKRRRIVAYLARRGYSGRDITELVDKVV
jgi:regulatory protein